MLYRRHRRLKSFGLLAPPILGQPVNKTLPLIRHQYEIHECGNMLAVLNQLDLFFRKDPLVYTMFNAMLKKKTNRFFFFEMSMIPQRKHVMLLTLIG